MMHQHIYHRKPSGRMLCECGEELREFRSGFFVETTRSKLRRLKWAVAAWALRNARAITWWIILVVLLAFWSAMAALIAGCVSDMVWCPYETVELDGRRTCWQGPPHARE